MKIDAITFRVFTRELEEKLVNARLQKIFQPEDFDFVFRFRIPGNNYFLYLSLEPGNQTLYPIPGKFSQSREPTAFCMMLRKHLAGGKILYINQAGSDRIIHFHIASYVEEEEDVVERILIIELTGKTSNIILCDEHENIIGAFNHKDSRRKLAKGELYEAPPPPRGINPFLIEKNHFVNLLVEEKEPDLTIKDRIFNAFTGMIRDYVREILFHSGLTPSTPLKNISSRQREKVWESFSAFFKRIDKMEISPMLYYPDNDENMEKNPVRWALWDFDIFKEKPRESVQTLGDALEACFFPTTLSKNFDDIHREMKSIISKRIKKVKTRVGKQEKDLEGAEKTVKLKKWGELILANLNNIPAKSGEILVDDYYQDPPEKIMVKLDPSLSASDNAQKYFNKYKKAKRGLEKIEERLEISREELSDLETALYEVEEAETIEDIESITSSIDLPEMFISATAGKRKNQEAMGPRKFNLASGYVALVGRNSKQNDQLTLHIAQKDDIWFHARQIPGSHVVLRIQKPSNPVPDEVVYKAACIAAYYSKARKSSKVPVDYTRIKDVRKAKGQKPGKVFYVNEKTLFVKPDIEIK